MAETIQEALEERKNTTVPKNNKNPEVMAMKAQFQDKYKGQEAVNAIRHWRAKTHFHK